MGAPVVSGTVVGVDGGGTSVRAVVVDAQGRELGRARGPGVAVRERDAGPAAEAVAAVVRQAVEAAGGARPRALWAGLAGAGRERARTRAEEALRDLDLAERVRVGTDVAAAFADAFGAGAGEEVAEPAEVGAPGRPARGSGASTPGLLVVAGTGSVALGRGPDGTLHRVGGWGPEIGDEGGGHWLVRQALGCLSRAEDGRGPDTALRRTIPSALGLERATDLVGWAAGATRREVAALAPAVMDTAASGDAVASALLADAAAALRAHVLALLAALDAEDDPPPVALCGGLLEPGTPLRRALETLLGPLGVQVLEGRVDAALGAARLARRLADRG